MKNLIVYFFLLLIVSCNQTGQKSSEKIITVSIPPFKYFIGAIGGSDFSVNIMVPPGANPHIYEPVPDQITNLRKSVAYVSDGYLGFEMTWLDRFYETNPGMKRLSLGKNIDLIKPDGQHNEEHSEGADPHYWVSPKCALIIASEIKTLLTGINPEKSEIYAHNYDLVIKSIDSLDREARDRFASFQQSPFMIFHPTLGYLARDYGLVQVAVEKEGKEPNPSSIKELIDFGKSKKIKIIFVQREYDVKNARAIASETGATIETIDPLSENWKGSVQDIINALYRSFKASE